MSETYCIVLYKILYKTNAMNKKFLFIGDIHGQDTWGTIANDALAKFQDVIFVGDYVDSFNISPALIIHNLEAIIGFKIQNPDKVTLLLGNHDWAYIYDEQAISGFKWHQWQQYKKIFKDNIDLFDLAWGYTNPMTKKYTLATHAGLTKGYWNRRVLPRLEDPEDKLCKLTEGKGLEMPMHEVLNYLKGDEKFWAVGPMRGGFGHPSPLWADYQELLEDPYEGINQVFGHTASGTISTHQNGADLIIKVDGHWNNRLGFMTVEL